MIEVPEKLEKWFDAAPWLPAVVKVVLQQAMLAAIPTAWLACVVITSWWAAQILWALRGRAFRVWMQIKRAMVMAEWVSRAEAERVVAASDFVAVRVGNADSGLGSAMARLASAVTALDPLRSKGEILRSRFFKRMLADFEKYDPDGLKDGKYNLDSLNVWLDLLIDKEVEEQIGVIPNVRRP